MPSANRGSAATLKSSPLGVVIEDPLPKDDGESSVGNLFADWMRASTGADVTIPIPGGIRIALPAGPLTYGRLFELTPFDNHRAILTLTGAELTGVVRY